MTRNLSLKSEALADLTAEELGRVAAGDYTGNPFCVLTLQQPCISDFCTGLDCVSS